MRQDTFCPDVFELLNALFTEFDDAVERAGMFKYQHVGPSPPPMSLLV
jgi:hypothetical protein